MKKEDEFVGRKFGKLKVLQKCRSEHGDILFWCRCICGQSLFASEDSLRNKEKRSCNRCAYRGRHAFKSNEIVIMKNVFGEIPRGEQAIVMENTGGKNPLLYIEYQGKKRRCFASDVASTGKIFRRK